MDKTYIASTLASGNIYTNYAKGGADMPVVALVDGREGVFIEGGAGIANRLLVTPEGVITEVTAEQLDYLQANEIFKLHQKNGFVKILSGSREPNEVAATGDMNKADASRQLTEGDLVDPDTKSDDNESLTVRSGGKTSKSK